MKKITGVLLSVLALLVIAGCSSTATATPAAIQGNNPYAPQPGDDALREDTIQIDSASLAIRESQPPQVSLNIDYFPPTPCHKLRVVVNQPDAQNRMDIKAYTVVEKDKPCNLMALATPLHVSLDLGKFPTGHYSIWLNDEKIDEFDA